MLKFFQFAHSWLYSPLSFGRDKFEVIHLGFFHPLPRFIYDFTRFSSVLCRTCSFKKCIISFSTKFWNSLPNVSICMGCNWLLCAFSRILYFLEIYQIMLRNTDGLVGTIPEKLFVVFQMTFSIITPALIVGAYVERIKFS